MADEREDLVGREHVDADRRRRGARAIDVADRVGVKLPDASRASMRPWKTTMIFCFERLDSGRSRPSSRAQRSTSSAETSSRRRPPNAGSSGCAQSSRRRGPCSACVDGRARGSAGTRCRPRRTSRRAYGAGERAGARPDEQRVEPLLRQAPRVEARRRTPARRRCRSDLAMHLAPVAEKIPFSAICSYFAIPRAGFEPATCGLEVRCSIQLSYRGRPSVRGMIPSSPRHRPRRRADRRGVVRDGAADRDGRIRTDDPRVPNAVLYQAELHPVQR